MLTNKNLLTIITNLSNMGINYVISSDNNYSIDLYMADKEYMVITKMTSEQYKYLSKPIKNKSSAGEKGLMPAK